MRLHVLVCALLPHLLFSSGVEAQEQAAPLALRYENTTAARLNPQGLINYTELTLRSRLYDSESEVLRTNYAGAGIATSVTPAWAGAGLLVELQPLSVLRLWARYDLMGYYGTFNLASSYRSATDDFSDSTVEARAEDPATANYSTTGTQLTLGATLQAKMGPIAARSLFRATRVDFDLQRADQVFYQQFVDLLMPDEGWAVINDVDVLWVSDLGLAIGARWTWAQAFYQERHFRADEYPDADPDNHIHRLGLLAAYQLSDAESGIAYQPTVILLAQWHLAHRWRTGQEVSTAIPYLAIAFRFKGDLFRAD